MSIDPARWRRIQELFHAALELPEQSRRAFLESECADDPSLVSDVEALLVEDARHTSLLDRGVERVASEVLDGSVPHLEFAGPYSIRGVIGHGGMGVVYLAERVDL